MTKSTYNILIVEQDKKYYDLIEQTLQELDDCCVIKVFEEIDSALSHIKSTEYYDLPQLIYLNMDIDSEHTYKFLEEIKTHSEYRKIPIIIFTMDVEIEKVNKAYRLYANSIIELPKDETKLKELVRESRNFWLKTVKLPQRDALI